MDWGLYIMAAAYTAAGIYHFVNPRFFENIVPPALPAPKLLVYVSGVFEILFGIGVLFPTTQSYSAVGIILLLIAVFPANIYMAVGEKFKKIPAWIRYGRLPLQFVLIWWAWGYV